MMNYKHSNQIYLILLLFILPLALYSQDQDKNLRAYGVEIGVMETGPLNAITDVEGVHVGHTTLIEGDSIRTGVTAVLPHPGNIFQEKVPGAVFAWNGFGKLAGSTQVEELGTIETPIILTNTLSVPTAADALIDYTFSFDENREIVSVNPVVGETNDNDLNDIRGRHIKKEDVLSAIYNAKNGPVTEGNVGAGTGTISLGFKGGIGTSSRKIPESLGGYTVGVLVQTNFSGVLQIAGVPVGKELGEYYLKNRLQDTSDGSCMIVVATDAPLLSRNLKRLAKRAILGLARAGAVSYNGSGDYVIAFSSAEEVRIPYRSDQSTRELEILRNDAVSPLFMAAAEATEEAIINSLFHAETMTGRNGRTVEELPVNRVLELLRRYGRID